MRLVVLSRLLFLVSFWLLRFFPPAASRPFEKKRLFRPTTVHEGPRVSPHMLGQLLSVCCFVFLCRPLAVSFRGPLSVRPVHLLHPFSFPSLAPAEVPPFRVL